MYSSPARQLDVAPDERPASFNRCPAAPVREFVNAGGTEAETVARRCLCNGLMADVGLAQVRADGTLEPPMVTSGDHVSELAHVAKGRTSYAAAEVLEYLLAGVEAGVAVTD